MKVSLFERIEVILDKKHLKEALAAHPQKVIYLPSEIEELDQLGGDPEFVKNAHSIKKNFDGWILPKAKWKSLGIDEDVEGEMIGRRLDRSDHPQASASLRSSSGTMK
jgi:hypothetical protein